MQPAKFVAEASIANKLPTWRYYFNATIPNLQPEGYPTLGAFHGEELSLIWEFYPTENATTQEKELSVFLQTAWANFAKDPFRAGPGWKQLNATSGDGLACIGCNGGSGVNIISQNLVDARCSIYGPLFTATTPYF